MLQLGVQQPEPAPQVPPQPSAAPQSLPPHRGVQQPEPALQAPPQPSAAPQILPPQVGVQQPEPVLQVPPQPSLAPQALLAQVGLQAWQSLPTQYCPAAVQSLQSPPARPQTVWLSPASQLPSILQQPAQLAAQVLKATFVSVSQLCVSKIERSSTGP